MFWVLGGGEIWGGGEWGNEDLGGSDGKRGGLGGGSDSGISPSHSGEIARLRIDDSNIVNQYWQTNSLFTMCAQVWKDSFLSTVCGNIILLP